MAPEALDLRHTSMRASDDRSLRERDLEVLAGVSFMLCSCSRELAVRHLEFWKCGHVRKVERPSRPKRLFVRCVSISERALGMQYLELISIGRLRTREVGL